MGCTPGCTCRASYFVLSKGIGILCFICGSRYHLQPLLVACCTKVFVSCVVFVRHETAFRLKKCNPFIFS
ncbi:hypothetical protein DUNSADRAFT_11090 [Dunaliella salina]|uniref:Encoded protein n=1 Tax=Dunaliella salina TaxID=3046 RepID=A0ABQ7GE25_DUNSA|nr:hypothetical protein DUNSADRAFT_11090 [Dunaliella salina]|eukprot:KAF5832870.1 hypothetical protein DUNSADRAFT_11090 [Dunaliella salina]